MALPRRMYKKVLRLLKKAGRLSLPELHAFMPDYTRKNLTDVLAQARGIGEGEVRKIYIVDYVRQEGKGGLASPVYTLGTEDDVVRPKSDPRIARQKYDAKPENAERRRETERTRRRNATIEKNASKNVFRFMARPPSPVELTSISIRAHVLEDDDEVPLQRDRKSSSKALSPMSPR